MGINQNSEGDIENELLNNSFLTNYLIYTRFHESPDDFHLWVALTIIGAATARKVYFDQVFHKVYCNLYTGLVAGSATCKKSSAMDIGTNLFQKAFGEDETFYLLKGKATPNDIIDTLGGPGSEDGYLFLQLDELAMLFTNEMKHLGIVELLTELYTCPESREYRTKTAGKYVVRNAFINILGGAVPAYLQKHSEDVFEEGLIGRFGFLHRERRKRSSARLKEIVDITEHDLYEKVLIAQLRGISRYIGEATLDDAAGKIYDDWYDSIPEKEFADKNENYTTGFVGRKGDHALKYGILLFLAKNPFGASLKIDASSIQGGIEMAEQSDISMRTIFGECAKGDVMKAQMDIESLLGAKLRISRTMLYTPFRRVLNYEGFSMIMTSLELARFTLKVKEGRTIFYYYVPESLREVDVPNFERLVVEHYNKEIDKRCGK